MIVGLKLSRLREIRWYEYAIRFLVGGITTVVAGMIAEIGPDIGGLFLAFPAIFPASATLVESHERERKEKAGLSGARRGKDAAALESAGAALGSIGLMAFGAVIWQTVAIMRWVDLLFAFGAWVAVSLWFWSIRRHLRVTR